MSELAVQECGIAVAGMDRVADAMVGQLIPMLWALPIEELSEVVLAAARIEHATYIVRGAAGYTMHERIRGSLGSEGGMKAEMDLIARRWGVEYNTLMTDIQIYRHILMQSESIRYQDPEVAVDAANVLFSIPSMELVPPRWVMETALKSPDKLAAVNAAMGRIGEGSYTRAQMRADVAGLRVNVSRQAEQEKQKSAGNAKQAGSIGSGLSRFMDEEPLGGDDSATDAKPGTHLVLTDTAAHQPVTTQEIEAGGKWFEVRCTDAEAAKLFRAAALQKCSAVEVILQLINGEMLSIDEPHMLSLIYQHSHYRKTRGYTGTLTDYVHTLIHEQEKHAVKAGMTPHLTKGQG